MSPLTYDALVAELFPRLTGGIRWGLERTERMLAAVGDPHRSFSVIHVGGTNGKGSVAACIDAVLRRAGHRTGLYTSPHLCTFRERIRIDGEPISTGALLAAAERLWPHVQREQPSFFEATTAIAFLALADAGVSVAVVEVGLGGRLDSTNVVDPDVVVLTNVSMDHVQLLGPSLDDVAREKAGIIKTAAPVVTAERGTSAARIFAEAAAASGATLHTLSEDDLTGVSASVDGTSFTLHAAPGEAVELHVPLVGGHQALNAALAARAVDLLPHGLRPQAQHVAEGLARVRWPGRLQIARVHDVTWVFDVAHNVAGVHALAAALGTLPLPRPLIALVGVLGDKDWAHMLAPIQGAVDEVILTVPPTAPPERLWEPEEALRVTPAENSRVIRDFSAALDAARTAALDAGGTIVVTGSFHTVGDALAALDMCGDGADFTVERPPFAQPG